MNKSRLLITRGDLNHIFHNAFKKVYTNYSTIINVITDFNVIFGRFKLNTIDENLSDRATSVLNVRSWLKTICSYKKKITREMNIIIDAVNENIGKEIFNPKIKEKLQKNFAKDERKNADNTRLTLERIKSGDAVKLKLGEASRDNDFFTDRNRDKALTERPGRIMPEVKTKTGGKRKKRPKTVKKYRYVKNKTGKKRKRSEKIKIIKKNKNKMKISQAIIKHL